MGTASELACFCLSLTDYAIPEERFAQKAAVGNPQRVVIKQVKPTTC
jgi:hypothetical protein